MTTLQIHIENPELSRTLLESFKNIEGVKISEIDSTPLEPVQTSPDQGYWIEMLSILAELPKNTYPS